MSDDILLGELEQAVQENQHGRPCQVCCALEAMSPSARNRVEQALTGTLVGERKLSEILTRNGYTVGRRAVARHRREGHTAP